MSDDKTAALQVGKRIAGGKGLSQVLLRRASEVELDWDVRQKSRFAAVDSKGRTLNVFLPRGTVLRGGDVLVAEDGSLIRVKAAPQPVLVVTHCPDHGTPFDLLRAAYHLGNRHVPLQIGADYVAYAHDHVLDDMVRGLGLTVTARMEPFEPEAGAFAHEHDHEHVNVDDHVNDHGGGPVHVHVNDHGADHGHGGGHGRDRKR